MGVDFAELVVRLLFAAPVLYVALVMALEPGSFLRWSDDLGRAVRTVADPRHSVLRGRSRPVGTHSRAATRGLRFAGMTVVLLVFVWFLN
jgi:hypothetical protein